MNNNKQMKPLELVVMAAASIGANFLKVGSLVAADAVEAGTTDTVLNVTAHLAVAGDQIVMTNGDEDNEAREVLSVTVNAITLASALSGAPSAAETFNIIRPVLPKQVGILHIENASNARITLSVDGVTDHMSVGPVGTRDLDLRANNLRLGSDNTNFTETNADSRQFLWVKFAASAPTLESLYIDMIE